MHNFIETAFLTLKREKDNKLELIRTRERNEQYKNRFKTLEKENKELREKFTSTEIDIITKKNNSNHLLETLQKRRRAVLIDIQKLQICKEQIDSIYNYLEELKPIKEKLNFKRNVTECLYDLLVKTKLRIAESNETLQELYDYFTQLEYDVEKTKEITQQDIGQWRDEFLSARIREADVILEFDKIKREVAIIKNDLEDKILIRYAQKVLDKIPSSNKINLSKTEIKYFQKILHEKDGLSNNISELHDEIDFLKQKVKKLEFQKYDYDKKIQINEETKVNLNEVKRCIWLREFETKQETGIIRKKYKKLSEKMLRELECIQNNIEEKDLTIAYMHETLINKQQEYARQYYS